MLVLALGAGASAQPTPTPTPPAPEPAPVEPAPDKPPPAPSTTPPPASEPAAPPATGETGGDGFSIESIALESLLDTATRDRIKFEAFGDLSLGFLAGNPRDAGAADRFEAFGLDPHPKNSHDGFGLAGTDFVVLGDLADDLRYLGEVNFQVERGASTEFEIDVERMMLDYALREQIGIRAGLFFTPIGYHNRTQYSRAWLTYSASVPALFEEELGFVPTHTIGLQAYGTFQTGAGDLNYAASVGNGRTLDPSQNIYARDDAPKSYTAMLELRPRIGREVAFGVSGWFDQIQTYRLDDAGSSVDINAPSAPEIEIRELGLDVHATIDTDQATLFAEYVLLRHAVTDGVVLPIHERTWTHGLYVEAAYHVTPKLHPFVRYDWVRLPEDGGPYYPLRLTEDSLARHYVPDEHLLAGGVAYDLSAANRLKAEYSVALEGPRKLHAVILQTAFAIR